MAAISVAQFVAAPSLGTGIDAALDVAGALPGVPSVGVIRRIAGAADDAADVVQQGKRLFSKADRAEGFEKAKDASGVARCEYCKQPLDPKAGKPNSYEADHRKPYSKGGQTSQDNLAPACRTCNRSKGAKELEEWKP